MLKLLIADDERMVREGLLEMCDWSAHGIECCPTASNGGDALELILEHRPDIVVIDIKMPVLTGIEVIKQAAPLAPGTRFLILSGYGEFEYAKEAMSFGVEHFLLKPCNDDKMIEAILRVREEILSERQRSQLLADLQESFQRILPGLKEQFLRDLIGDRITTEGERSYYAELLGLRQQPVSLALLESAGRVTFEKLFFFLEAVRGLAGDGQILLSGAVNQRLLLVLPAQSYEALFGLMKRINSHMSAEYLVRFRCALCDTLEFSAIAAVHRTLADCLTQDVLLGEDGVITPEDIVASRAPVTYAFDYDELTANIRGGNLEQTAALVDGFFQGLAALRPSPAILRAYSLQLFTHVINQAQPDRINVAFDEILAAAADGASGQLQEMIHEIAAKTAEANRHENYANYSHLVRSVLVYIEQYLDDERLSLRWIASELLYINVDYLGKIFKREMGERFTGYLLNRRIEKAKELLAGGGQMRVYEVAKRVGFGENTQYFSLQFKKATGNTPREYGQHAQ